MIALADFMFSAYAIPVWIVVIATLWFVASKLKNRLWIIVIYVLSVTAPLSLYYIKFSNGIGYAIGIDQLFWHDNQLFMVDKYTIHGRIKSTDTYRLLGVDYQKGEKTAFFPLPSKPINFAALQGSLFIAGNDFCLEKNKENSTTKLYDKENLTEQYGALLKAPIHESAFDFSHNMIEITDVQGNEYLIAAENGQLLDKKTAEKQRGNIPYKKINLIKKLDKHWQTALAHPYTLERNGKFHLVKSSLKEGPSGSAAPLKCVKPKVVFYSDKQQLGLLVAYADLSEKELIFMGVDGRGKSLWQQAFTAIELQDFSAKDLNYALEDPDGHLLLLVGTNLLQIQLATGQVVYNHKI